MKVCKSCGIEHGTATKGCRACYMREVYYKRPGKAEARKASSAAYHARTRDDPRAREQRTRWTREHPEEARAIQQRSARAQRARFQAVIDRAKSVPCAMCGVQHPPAAMDLHHRNPVDKLFNIPQILAGAKNARVAGTGRTRAQMLEAEIAKCDVLCAVCHRLHHAAER